MENKNKTNNISFLLLIVIGLIVAGVIFLYPIYVKYQRQINEKNHLTQILDQKKLLNSSLIKERNDLETNPKAVEKVAREVFEYCRDGEIIMVYQQK